MERKAGPLDRMTQRAEMAAEFIDTAGWSDACRTVIAGDASNRRYERLTQADGTTLILMDAPPDKGEDVRPFIQIAEFLTKQGFSAPQIYDRDSEKGFLLIEDLGNGLFARVLQNDTWREAELYEAATDVLGKLVETTPPPLKRYDAPQMAEMAALAFEWYAAGISGASHHKEQNEFHHMIELLLEPLDAHAGVLIQRDYHAENMLWLPDRKGIARVGLIDFQDAMLGHPAYDVVSFLQDARRDVSKETEQRMKQRFCDISGTDRPSFDADYALLGVQRNLRILGVFARLCIRDGKAHYVDLIPRVWGHIETNLSHPALDAVRAMVERNLPRPTPENLELLRSKCATHPTQ